LKKLAFAIAALVALVACGIAVSAQTSTNCTSSVVSGDPSSADGLTVNIRCLTTTTTTTTTAPPTTTTSTTTTTVPATTTTTAPPTTTTTTVPPTTGWPTAATTGPTGPLAASGTITVTQNGAVVQNKDVTGCIRVRADNVTIRNVKVTSTCFNGIEIRDWDGYDGLLIEDVEVNGRDTTDNCIAFGNYTARRVDLYGCADGAKIGSNTTIVDSYIHDLMNGNGCHCDGVQSTGSSNVTLRGNNIDVPGSGAAVFLGEEYQAMVNFTADRNRLNGGNYTFYGSWSQGYKVPVNMRVTNNTFGPDRRYGTHVYVHPSTVWTGNALTNGSPVNL
jgi:hypothetical protein